MSTYVAPSMGIAGLTIPTYQDILDYLIAQKKIIYGDDIYLGIDSTDYQELSVIALMYYDNLCAIQLAYNNRSPVTAIGSGLDAVVKINAISRRAATYSTVDVIISGTPGTVITNGQVEDINGEKWNLPTTVTIPVGGYITATATADSAGAIQAAAGEVNKIVTLQSGWASVTNESSASAGTATETDSELRTRQTSSTALSSTTPIDAVMGNVLNVSGVTRAKGYENDTGITDPETGVPANSICVVVEGGDSTEIAAAIWDKKTLGTRTYGDTSVEVSDYGGNANTINFERVSQVSISVKITILAMDGYLDTTGDLIEEAVVDYINAIEIGGDVYRTKIIAVASLLDDESTNTFRVVSIELGRPGDSPPTAEADVTIDFNEAAYCSLDESPALVELVVEV
jgi:uncharacterized phage protein gp47/JayE